MPTLALPINGEGVMSASLACRGGLEGGIRYHLNHSWKLNGVGVSGRLRLFPGMSRNQTQSHQAVAQGRGGSPIGRRPLAPILPIDEEGS